MKKIRIVTRGIPSGDPGPATISIRITGPDKKAVLEISESIGNAYEDYAEYVAVARALQAAADHFGDETKELDFELVLQNELVKQQLNAECPIHHPGLVPYFIEVHNLRVLSFPRLQVLHVARQSKQK